MLTDQQLLLYNRQIVLQEVGVSGQERLAQAHIAVVGLGGLGSSVSLYLAAAGIGTMTLIDHDRVAPSNLHRQILYGTGQVEQAKTMAASDRLRSHSPGIKLLSHAVSLTGENGGRLLAAADFVVDATDNAAAKFLIAGLCHQLRCPYSHAGVRGFQGQTMTVLPGRTTCCRCLFPQSAEQLEEASCSSAGIIGAVPGVIGSMQALEAIKFITGAGSLMTDRLIVFNGLEGTARTIAVQPNPHCPLCGTG